MDTRDECSVPKQLAMVAVGDFIKRGPAFVFRLLMRFNARIFMAAQPQWRFPG